MAKKSTGFTSQLIWAPDPQAGLWALINKFGRDAVHQAFKQVSKPPMGRSPVDDTADLFAIYAEDAEQILEGNDPFRLRSNRFLARKISEVRPGHSREATERRIMAKLARNRKKSSHFAAANKARSLGHAKYVEVLAAAISKTDDFQKKILKMWMSAIERELEKYLSHFGKSPLIGVTYDQIFSANAEADRIGLPVKMTPKIGLLGLVDAASDESIAHISQDVKA